MTSVQCMETSNHPEFRLRPIQVNFTRFMADFVFFFLLRFTCPGPCGWSYWLRSTCDRSSAWSLSWCPAIAFPQCPFLPCICGLPTHHTQKMCETHHPMGGCRTRTPLSAVFHTCVNVLHSSRVRIVLA